MLVGALADHLLLRPHSASEHVDRLVKLGLVRRGGGMTDKRQVPVELTSEGKATAGETSCVDFLER